MKYRDFDNYDVNPSEQTIKNTKTNKELKPSVINGYVNYDLYKNGKKYHLKAHRIFWECVNGEIPDGMEIDHINTNGTDNRLENLIIVSHKDNCNNPRTIEKYQKSNKVNGKHPGKINREDLSKKVLAFSYLTKKLVGIYQSLQEASRMLGVPEGNISRNIKGRGKQEKGYTFKLV